VKPCEFCKVAFEPSRSTHRYCSKSCYDRAWRLRSAGQLKAKYQEWYGQNRERALAQKKRYYLENFEAISIRKKLRDPTKKAAERRTPSGRFAKLRGVAKLRGIECELSFEHYLQLIAQPCFYCGGKLPEVGHGIDRINSNKGYVEQNVRPCCTQCNLAKNQYTEMEFREWLERIMKAKWFNSDESIKLGSVKVA
jgi:5-methylcytosine-specific restriction endonuclease McrA